MDVCRSTKTLLIQMMVLSGLFSACRSPETKAMEVRASAYNSVRAQTDKHSNIAAWGDTLKPDMKVIAISRDLLDSGLYYGMEVTIDGLEGKYIVLDKMQGRWTKKIDIYMGKDVAKAREWGSQKVTIRWTPVDSTKITSKK
jgi:3D (Asp-Asp-Asp) domain-containing protein